MGQTETSAIFAGTGLHIDIDVKKEKRRRKEENIFNQMDIEKQEEEGEVGRGKTKSKKKKDSKLKHEKPVIEVEIKNDGETEEEKKKRLMREKAKALSRRIAGVTVKEEPKDRHNDDELEAGEIREESPTDTSPTGKTTEKSKECHKKDGHRESKKDSKRDGKKKRRKDAKFEGKRIKGLKKWEPYKRPKTDDDDHGDDKNDDADDKGSREKSAAQDEYVLAKLFKKSGVHSALRHDAIVDSGAPDYAIVEAEAKKVAAEAAARLKV